MIEDINNDSYADNEEDDDDTNTSKLPVFPAPFQDKKVVNNSSGVRVLCWVMTGPQNHYTKVGIGLDHKI